jgi:WXXGXW repeat (2 copies)
MDTLSSLILCGAIAGLTVGGGCAARRGVEKPAPVAVANPAGKITEAPPQPPVEVVGEPPSREYVWIPGVWKWRGYWLWVPGNWAKRPQPNAVWIRGRWVHQDDSWTWVRGYWR